MIVTENLHERAAGEARQIELRRLREARKIRDDQDGLVFELAQERQHLRVIRMEKFERAAREGLEILPHRDHAAHPPEQRRQILLLVLDVDRFVVILGIDRDRQIELLRIRLRKTGIAIRAPLHRGAAAVAIAEIEIVAHPDLVAVIDDWRAGHGEEEDVQQLDFAPAVGQQRREAATNAEIDARVLDRSRKRATCSRALRRSPFRA